MGSNRIHMFGPVISHPNDMFMMIDFPPTIGIHGRVSLNEYWMRVIGQNECWQMFYLRVLNILIYVNLNLFNFKLFLRGLGRPARITNHFWRRAIVSQGLSWLLLPMAWKDWRNLRHVCRCFLIIYIYWNNIVSTHYVHAFICNIL